MRIRHAKIHNFRSVQDVDIDVSDMLILLGPNNHGKSNILSAIEFGLTTGAKPSNDDLCATAGSEERSLWVEITFAELTHQEQTTFQKYLRNDNSIRIRKTATFDDSGSPAITYQGYVEEPEEWWLKGTAFERLQKKDQIQAEAKDVPALSALMEGAGKVTKQRISEFQQEYIEKHRQELTFAEVLEAGPLLGAKNVAGGILPDFYLVPAVRDLSDETKTKGTTVFGRLLQRAVQEMTAHDPQFLDLQDRIQALIRQLNLQKVKDGEKPSQLAQLESLISNELKTWKVDVSIQVIPPEIEKILELGTELHLDDGLRTLAERKGHGLQRAVLFALLRAWANVLREAKREEAEAGASARRTSDSTYFAIEEPELFLHPHAQRQLAVALRELASAPQHQVFVCTHSTHFVNMDHYQDIVNCYKPDGQGGTRVRQCSQELFEGEGAKDKKNRFHMAAWINPDRGELFFAKKVVLVEGETEKTILPFLANRLGCLDPDISVIDCGSKFNLQLYIAVLNAFTIPYCVVHDEDPLPNPIPDDWNDDKRKAHTRTFAENVAIRGLLDNSIGCIEMLAPDFEGVSGVSRSQAEKKGKPIAALDHFQALPEESIPARLTEIVHSAYRLPGTPA